MATRQTFRDAVAAVFRERPGEWIDGRALAEVGGFYAFRTRVSECRRQLGMDIENRVVRRTNGAARSEYRYVPRAAQGAHDGTTDAWREW